MPATAGLLTVVPPSGLTVSVTITTGAGAAVTSYTAQNGSSAHASPELVSSSTDFHVVATGPYRVVTTLNGSTIDDRTVAVRSYGTVPLAVVQPVVDAPGELGALSSGTIAPWTITVDPFSVAIAGSNFDSLVVSISQVNCATRESNGAQNSDVTLAAVALSAGTWVIDLLHTINTDRGIYSFQLDDGAGGAFTEVATIDGYSASLTRNTRTTSGSFVVAAIATPRLFKIKMATKNASSSNYYGSINGIRFRRTA